MLGAAALISEGSAEDRDTIVNHACVLYKEGKFEEAKKEFIESMNSTNYEADVAYDIALCHYRLNEFGEAVGYISEIIQRGISEHPELSVSIGTSKQNGVELRSVGNSQILMETALVEAFNLKAAIEYQEKNLDGAKEALDEMPPRDEGELDPVTLHNSALVNMDSDAAGSYKKLRFLIKTNPCPPETLQNLLLLCCEHDEKDLAADLLADNQILAMQYIDREMLEFLDASVEKSTEEAYRKFGELDKKHIERLRKLGKRVADTQGGAIGRSKESDDAITEFERGFDQYIPVLMAEASIYWDLGNYAQVEKIFRQSAELSASHDVWKLNVAHTFFMESKFREAIGYYEPLVKKQQDDILSVSAMVLANLCVSFIMTSQNDEAEEWMRRIELAEAEQRQTNPEASTLHLCIVNLVIGTLYCSKGNYEFGISRITKSLEPYDEKLSKDTWMYAKRCFLGLIETLAKHMIMLKDNTFHEIIKFLDAAALHGRDVETDPREGRPNPLVQVGLEKVASVATEARLMKKMMLKLRDG
eukprot:TRINITY_DN1366_c0_g1_i5.p1 TRINITY_DN1366_c0_g1~~TRINITY_DN1366_c0_g1_i5.p1  ORF type:complete len:531 (+),score=213.64 TRINITY_DN1366_c0_g1_i5:114-1706(+)